MVATPDRSILAKALSCLASCQYDCIPEFQRQAYGREKIILLTMTEQTPSAINQTALIIGDIERPKDPADHTQIALTTSPTDSISANRKPWTLNVIHGVHSFLGKIMQTIIFAYKNMTWSEISGSLGDLGTYIPLVVVLARKRSIYLAPALFFGGLANLLTGLFWDVPMCVQPMKSIAAVAISANWNAQTVSAAGTLVGGLVFLIGITNLIEVVNLIVPVPVVAGLQIGVGLNLVSSGIKSIQRLRWVATYDSILLAFLVSLLCLYWLREDHMANVDRSLPNQRTLPRQMDVDVQNDTNEIRTVKNRSSWKIWQQLKLLWNKKIPHPVGIYLFLIGVIFAGIKIGTTKKSYGPFHFFGAPIALSVLGSVKAIEWKKGLLEGALPQLPLTCLNSVIAVCALAHGLYPEKRKPCADQLSSDAVVGRRQVAISVGLMNLCFVPVGSMPYCHGSGGLAGQHKMGARHGASVVFLGFIKMMFAIFFGAAALTLLDAMPVAILGVMVVISGHELATTGFYFLVSNYLEGDDFLNMDPSVKKIVLRRSISICTATAMIIIATGQVHYGVISGWVTHMILGEGLSDFFAWFSQRRTYWGCCKRRYVDRPIIMCAHD